MNKGIGFFVFCISVLTAGLSLALVWMPVTYQVSFITITAACGFLACLSIDVMKGGN